MKTILKYVIDVRHPSMPMPVGAKVVLVGHQPGQTRPGQVVLWAEVETSSESVAAPGDDNQERFEVRDFWVFGTGHPIRPGLKHVGSAICDEFVWHVFEKAG